MGVAPSLPSDLAALQERVLTFYGDHDADVSSYLLAVSELADWHVRAGEFEKAALFLNLVLEWASRLGLGDWEVLTERAIERLEASFAFSALGVQSDPARRGYLRPIRGAVARGLARETDVWAFLAWQVRHLLDAYFDDPPVPFVVVALGQAARPVSAKVPVRLGVIVADAALSGASGGVLGVATDEATDSDREIVAYFQTLIRFVYLRLINCGESPVVVDGFVDPVIGRGLSPEPEVGGGSWSADSVLVGGAADLAALQARCQAFNFGGFGTTVADLFEPTPGPGTADRTGGGGGGDQGGPVVGEEVSAVAPFFLCLLAFLLACLPY